MKHQSITRRSMFLAPLALAACQATGTSVSSGRATTSAYDGNYRITVSRVRNPTPAMREEIERWGDRPESLAFLTVQVQNGRMRLLSKNDNSVGPNYEDLNGAFYEGGLLELTTTAGYLVGRPSPFRLNISAQIGDALLSGQPVVLRPNGFDADFSAHVEIVRA